ncbi:MAG: PBSX family phage terminase large subunit [Ferruginibacter sp.]
MPDPLLFETTDLYRANIEATEDTIVNQGGTSSGKTYAIDQCIFTHAYEEPGSVCTIAGQDLPNLKVGAIRDADEIVKNSQLLQLLIKQYNKSEHTYYFHNGSIVEFKAYANPQDAKSGKRDYLFINEANGIGYEVFNELHLRTKKKTYIDYNPNEEFWVHEHLIGGKNVKLIISDHRHNPFVPDKIRAKIEALKDQDEELWKVYARGRTGKIEGLIFRNYNIVESVPVEAILIAGGMDFGFTNDPTAFLNVYKLNGELWVDELIYEQGLTNPDICTRLSDESVSKIQEIIADSAEPKSIAEINNFGWNLHPAQKGPDSIRSSINTLKKFSINITKRSSGIRKEIKSYKWKKKKDGKTLNEPVDFMNHSIDALRYVALNKLLIEDAGLGPSVW